MWLLINRPVRRICSAFLLNNFMSSKTYNIELVKPQGKAPDRALSKVTNIVHARRLDELKSNPLEKIIAYNLIPHITSLSPSSGSHTGGTSVTINGINFTGATSVKFGTSSATFAVNTGIKITATSPAHTAGAVNVTVGNANGTSIVATYTYT
jgi:hypothetical protein